MSLVKCGGGITDIRGTLGGQHFKRDKSGLHCSRMQRRVKSQSSAQAKQRNAFVRARTYTKDPRWVSYYIYRLLSDLDLIFNATVSLTPNPDCTGEYKRGGTYEGKDYWRHVSKSWFVWWSPEDAHWHITPGLGSGELVYFWKSGGPRGVYPHRQIPDNGAFVTLDLAPPPANYEIPRL